MEIGLWLMSFPGVFMILFAGALVERALRSRRGETGRGMGRGKRMATAVGTEELFAFFYQTKRNELRQREVVLVLRQEDQDGAPPRDRIDLDKGVVHLPRRANSRWGETSDGPQR